MGSQYVHIYTFYITRDKLVALLYFDLLMFETQT